MGILKKKAQRNQKKRQNFGLKQVKGTATIRSDSRRISAENTESGPRHGPSSGDEEADYLHLSGV